MSRSQEPRTVCHLQKNPKVGLVILNDMSKALWLALTISLIGCGPVLNDVTTDFKNPPDFRVNRELRKGSQAPTDYPGEKAARKQRKLHPDIGPLFLSLSADESYAFALTAARELGWKITDENRDEHRIEAVDTTLILRFKDDIVVRITPDDRGSRIDVRSTSRVGRSDVGKNAKRIRAYFDRIESSVPKGTTITKRSAE